MPFEKHRGGSKNLICKGLKYSNLVNRYIVYKNSSFYVNKDKTNIEINILV